MTASDMYFLTCALWYMLYYACCMYARVASFGAYDQQACLCLQNVLAYCQEDHICDKAAIKSKAASTVYFCTG